MFRVRMLEKQAEARPPVVHNADVETFRRPVVPVESDPKTLIVLLGCEGHCMTVRYEQGDGLDYEVRAIEVEATKPGPKGLQGHHLIAKYFTACLVKMQLELIVFLRDNCGWVQSATPRDHRRPGHLQRPARLARGS